MSVRLIVVLGLNCWFCVSQAQQWGLSKTTDDISTKYTRVGNIGLTVTNFGTVGTRNASWPQQPSCEYPRGSGIEHIYQGALWVGARIIYGNANDPRKASGEIFVSTGSHDRVASTRATGEGYEFTSEVGDTITELTSLETGGPPNAKFSVDAVSHEDLICDYTDAHTRVPQSGDSIINHVPLRIKVHQESYAWNYPFADFFVILRYVIKNASPVDTLDSVYVGMWMESTVRNTNLVRPSTPGYFNHCAFGYDSTRRMAYAFDFDGIPGTAPANSYVGIKLLGTSPLPVGVDSIGHLLRNTYYNAWSFKGSMGQALEPYWSPTDDFTTQDQYLSRYSRMTQSIPQEFITPLRLGPASMTYLLSTGPLKGSRAYSSSRLNPGDSVEVVYAVICARKFGDLPAFYDSASERSTLYTNAGWAQQAYNGEDLNGNDTLDAGEDLNNNGKLDRYTLPQPPRRPYVHAVVENQHMVVYWDSIQAQQSVDPISHKQDFEGYRIYRTALGSDFQSHEDFILNIPLVGEFDREDDNIGYNTGFNAIRVSPPKTFPPDTVHYVYRFPPAGSDVKSLNGWQYVFGVSAFDSGDAANNISSLESAKSLVRLIPGTPATSDKSASIGVYPNPYYARAYWDGGKERLRKIYFYNLPAHCDITIYTLAGDIVTVLHHDADTYDASDINWFDQFGDASTTPQFAGGEHAWDLITRHDQAIATGLYLFTVKEQGTGTIRRGRFLVIK